MAQIPYTKPYASSAELVEHLKKRGLVITDCAAAERKISEIGYDRLRIYFNSRRQKDVAGKPFQSGITFNDIMNLYELDEELRALCFRYCSKFQLAFRNVIAETLSSQHGSHPYFNPDIYASEKTQLSALKGLSDCFHKSKNKDQRAKHYLKKYNHPDLPPMWTLKEFMPFGAINVFFQTLLNDIRGSIAAEFGVTHRKTFEAWVSAFIDFRNACAHHDRLWNRTFQKQINTYRRKKVPSLPSAKLKAVLEALEYLLSVRGQSVMMIAEVEALLRRYPMAHPVELGF